MSLYVVKTFKETPSLITDIKVKLSDRRAMILPAYFVRIRKIYAQYELDVSGMDETAILSAKGKKARFVGPSQKECNGTYRVGELGLFATVALDGNMAICDIPKYAIIAIGDEIQRCGAFRNIVGYEVEYRVCLPKDVTLQDIKFVE